MDVSLQYVGKETIKAYMQLMVRAFFSMKNHHNHHISKTTCVALCTMCVRRLSKVRSILGAEITDSLVSVFILSRLDYCNALLLANAPPLKKLYLLTYRTTHYSVFRMR